MERRTSHELPRWLHVVFDTPNVLYDRGLGRLLGHRFLRLTHTGRRTGAHHHAVLEVVDEDRRTGAVVVASGFGPESDWFRNVAVGGPCWVDLGRGPRAARHEVLPADEAVALLAGYERRHRLVAPVLRLALGAMAGHRYGGTPEERRRLVAEMPLVRFTPDPPG